MGTSGDDDGGGTGEGEAEGLMRSRYSTITTPTWPCPYCVYVHYAADLVPIDGERLQCYHCGQAFTPAKGGGQSVDRVQGPG